MIYLDNTTSAQTLWIPRNDGNGYIHTGSSQSYQEGYEDGIEYQKSLLSSSAFTENGEYERENGWSAITVNVEPSLEEINVVISADTTTITPSSGYDGFSAVMVDATEYGQTNYDSGFDDGYTDGYSSGSSEGYDSGYNEGYQSGSTDGFNSGYTSGETHQKSLLGTTAFTINGSYSAENGYSAITVNVPQTGSTAVLGVGSFSANGTYSASTDNLDGYSAITVNVPTSGEREIIMVTTGWCWFDTNYTMNYGDSIEIEHCTFGKSGIVQGRHQQYVGGNQSEVFRIGENENYLYLKYFKNFSSAGGVMPLPSSGSLIEDKTINFSSTGFVIDGNVITSYTTTELASTAHLVFFADTVSGNDNITGQTAKMGVVRIYGSDGTLKATFKPMLDELNVPFFKYVEEDIDIYALGSGTPLYETIDTSYQSGYTDGQNSIISTFTATTATTNGVYGSSANPLSSITVNVPTIGVYGTKTITENGTYSASTDNFDGYSAITVNVPSSGERDIIICSSGQCWFDFDYTMVYGDYIDIEHCTFGKIGSHSGSSSHQQFIGGGNGEWLRIGQPSNNSVYFKYFQQNVFESTFSNDPFLNDNHLVFSKDAITIDGNIFTSYTTTYNSCEPIIKVFANTSGGNDKIKNQIAKVGTIRVYGVDETLKATFKPMLDEFNVPFFKYVEEDIDIYALGSGTPTYEFLPSSDYQSGYTDGQSSIISTFTATTATTNGVYGSSASPLSSITVNVPQTGHTDQELQDAYDSGYTSGENNVISTFSSITITQNGHYGSYAHPMTSITVNVPTSGGSGYSIDQLAIRDYNINNPTINTTDIKLFAFANSNLSGMLTIGSAVTNIYAYAFSYTNISGITFPQTIVGNEYGKMVMVGYGQFEGCGNLTSVNIPSYIEFTENARARNTYGIFEECRNLVSVNWDADRVPTYCFRYCSSLSAINLTNVTNIDDYSFMNCGSLSSITIPSVCTRIGNGAFGNCSSLNEINVLATTAPTLGVVAFTNTPTGTVHYPQGSDYSSWQSNQYLSGWTFVGDL